MQPSAPHLCHSGQSAALQEERICEVVDPQLFKQWQIQLHHSEDIIGPRTQAALRLALRSNQTSADLWEALCPR